MHELVDRLLVLGRVDEAVSEVEQMDDTALLRTANLFRTHQRDELAQKLVVDRAKSSTGDRLIIWLKEFAEEQGDSESALQYTSSLLIYIQNQSGMKISSESQNQLANGRQCKQKFFNV